MPSCPLWGLYRFLFPTAMHKKSTHCLTTLQESIVKHSDFGRSNEREIVCKFSFNLHFLGVWLNTSSYVPRLFALYSFICFFVKSSTIFNQYLLNTYYVAGTVLGIWDTSVNKEDKAAFPYPRAYIHLPGCSFILQTLKQALGMSR